MAGFQSPLLAYPEAGEAGDHDVLPDLGGNLFPHLLDRLGIMLSGVHMLLVKQGDVLLPLGYLAIDDALDNVVGLAFLPGLLFEDPALGSDLFLRDVVAGDMSW